MMKAFDRRRKVVVEGLNALPGVSCITPKGAFYAFPNVSKTGWKAKKLASELLDECRRRADRRAGFRHPRRGLYQALLCQFGGEYSRALERMKEFLARTRTTPATHDAAGYKRRTLNRRLGVTRQAPIKLWIADRLSWAYHEICSNASSALSGAV